MRQFFDRTLHATGSNPALTSQDSPAILSSRMTVTADMICSLDWATDLGLAALANCIDKNPVALYQTINLVGCQFAEQDKKLCQLTDAQLVDAIEVTPTEIEAYSRDNSDFSRDLTALDSSNAAKLPFSWALAQLKTAKAHRPVRLKLGAGRPGEKSALNQLHQYLTYCPALQILALDETQVTDLAALITNAPEITSIGLASLPAQSG